jgi:hypothetical protein
VAAFPVAAFPKAEVRLRTRLTILYSHPIPWLHPHRAHERRIFQSSKISGCLLFKFALRLGVFVVQDLCQSVLSVPDPPFLRNEPIHDLWKLFNHSVFHISQAFLRLKMEPFQQVSFSAYPLFGMVHCPVFRDRWFTRKWMIVSK